MAADAAGLQVQACAGGWVLVGEGAGEVELVNDCLGYLADRNYSLRTVSAYAFDLLHLARWLSAERLTLEGVDSDVLLRYLAACRSAVLPHQVGGNVYSIRDGRNWRCAHALDPDSVLARPILPAPAGRCPSPTEAAATRRLRLASRAESPWPLRRSRARAAGQPRAQAATSSRSLVACRAVPGEAALEPLGELLEDVP